MYEDADGHGFLIDLAAKGLVLMDVGKEKIKEIKAISLFSPALFILLAI